jgi:hypothetical protein
MAKENERDCEYTYRQGKWLFSSSIQSVMTEDETKHDDSLIPFEKNKKKESGSTKCTLNVFLD